MFPILGPDYITASGERRYKSTDPATVVSAEDMNQVVLSLHRVITATGLALNADNAAEVSANWGQLVQAILRLSHQHPASLIQNAVVNTGAGFEITLGAETRILTISEDSSRPYAPFNILSSSTYERRELIVQNITGSPKVFSLGDSRYLDIMPGRCVSIYCVFGGGVSWWRSLGGGERQAVTFTLYAPNSVESEAVSGFVVNRDGATELIIPALRVPVDVAEGFISLRIPYIHLPWVQSAPSGTRRIATVASGYAESEDPEPLVGVLNPSLVASSYYEIAFYRSGGANFPETGGGLAGLDAQVITIRNQYP